MYPVAPAAQDVAHDKDTGIVAILASSDIRGTLSVVTLAFEEIHTPYASGREFAYKHLEMRTNKIEKQMAFITMK